MVIRGNAATRTAIFRIWKVETLVTSTSTGTSAYYAY
jgi:hypothetical protein